MIELWGGIEATVNRVHDRWFDQVAQSGHDRRPSDLDQIAALGIRTLRYPVLWERVAPVAIDQCDWRWTDERLLRLRKLGITPIVGLLHHGSGPAYTSLVDPEFPRLLARFARAVAERYPWVTQFTPVNEPLTTARFSALYGHWYPHGRNDVMFVRALLNQIKGISAAMRAIRSVTPDARLVQTEDCGLAFGTHVTARQAEFEEHRRWLIWDLLTGRVNQMHPLWPMLAAAGASERELESLVKVPCPPDVIGLNYYLTSDRFLDHRMERYPPVYRGGNDVQRYVDIEAVRAYPGGIVGHEAHLLAAWERYRLPVALTEVHLGCTREEQVRWLLEAWAGAHAARARGADVRAVTAWALFGSYDWDSLVTRDAQHYESGAFDVRSTPPRETALAVAIKHLATKQEPPAIDAAAGTPWWRRSERLIYGPPAAATRPQPARRPILIVGATGTLGRAFQRICEMRGLAARAIKRADAEIGDPGRVDAVIRHIDPWAVINAAGYVRVDAAETDREACWRANVTGALNLAAACRRRGVPLVTFSSDLVFDGREGRPYLESDQTCPRNVYGESKAEAERRVLDLLDTALVIRTSAFFGPWDDYNFLAALFHALDAGDPFFAAADSVVSPTYVPHLVNASLDLLIDGDRGIRHLANAGAVTWYEFACAAAATCGRSADGIHPAATAQIWGPAARPPFSALASERGSIMPSLADGLAEYERESRRAESLRGADTCVSP
jgi:dTDP-4-dehydrorhamnose reductase